MLSASLNKILPSFLKKKKSNNNNINNLNFQQHKLEYWWQRLWWKLCLGFFWQMCHCKFWQTMEHPLAFKSSIHQSIHPSTHNQPHAHTHIVLNHMSDVVQSLLLMCWVCPGVRCRVSAESAMGCRIDPSWWTYSVISSSASAPQLVYWRSWYVLSSLWDG